MKTIVLYMIVAASWVAGIIGIAWRFPNDSLGLRVLTMMAGIIWTTIAYGFVRAIENDELAAQEARGRIQRLQAAGIVDEDDEDDLENSDDPFVLACLDAAMTTGEPILGQKNPDGSWEIKSKGEVIASGPATHEA